MMPRRLRLRVQVLTVIVGLVTCPWLEDVWSAEGEKADVVLQHGKIYTADPARSIQQSIAFTRNSIVAVGDDDEVALLIGPETQVVDLGGKLILPGLIDTHSHPIVSVVERTKCSLADVKVKPPMIEALIEAIKPVIRDCLHKKPGGPNDWLEAVQFNYYGFKPTAGDLDSIEEKRPIVLTGNDGHTKWVNSSGLTLAGITPDTLDPPDGKIDRDASGAPTGLLLGDAMDLVDSKVCCEPGIEEQASLTAAALKTMSANGITSLMDASVGPTEEAVWRQLYQTGKLDMRVRMAIYLDKYNDDSDTVAQLVETSKEWNVDPNFLRAGVVKVFADSAMEYPAQLAALLGPYLHTPTDIRGKLLLDDSFAQLVTKLDSAGLTVHVHAVGDQAVRKTLDAFAAAGKANGDKDNRHQIAHLQLVDPADFPRFKALGVIADFQLLWAKREPATVEAIEPYLGAERYRRLYPAGSLHAAGTMIIGGSDWSVTSYNPFCAFQTAVTRAGEKGQEPLNIDERIPLETAVDAYTRNAAFAMKQDMITGSLEVGKRADLIVVDRDIFAVDPDTIADTKVLRTYLDGRLIYTAPANGTGMKRCDEIY